MGVSGPSLLIESTDSTIIEREREKHNNKVMVYYEGWLLLVGFSVA